MTDVKTIEYNGKVAGTTLRVRNTGSIFIISDGGKVFVPNAMPTIERFVRYPKTLGKIKIGGRPYIGPAVTNSIQPHEMYFGQRKGYEILACCTEIGSDSLIKILLPVGTLSKAVASYNSTKV
jgi:hypothetical protein